MSSALTIVPLRLALSAHNGSRWGTRLDSPSPLLRRTTHSATMEVLMADDSNSKVTHKHTQRRVEPQSATTPAQRTRRPARR